MALTKHFKDTVAKRAAQDSEYRDALFENAINEFLCGDLDVAKSLLRDYINATTQFEAVALELDKDPKSLQRMLGPSGNPTTENFTLLLKAIQKLEGFTIEARVNH